MWWLSSCCCVHISGRKANDNEEDTPASSLSEKNNHHQAFTTTATTTQSTTQSTTPTTNKKQSSDKDIVMARIQQNEWDLQYANNDMRADKDIVMVAVKKHGRTLQFASEDLKGDKDIVMAAVQQCGFALEFANKDLKSNKEIIMAAVKQNGGALVYANDDIMKFDKGFVKTLVIADVENDGMALEYASDVHRADKDVVCAAVRNNPNALKFALGGLSQDSECWIAAGLWNNKNNNSNNKGPNPPLIADCSTTIVEERPKLIVLSTRFSLRENSESSVTIFTKLLNNNQYIQNGNFVIYSPNAFNKCSCDPEWTRMVWPCRGTIDTCEFEDDLKEGIPNDKCCWRYSFRWHLEKAKENYGIMIQVVDYEESQTKSDHTLGDGQKIEKVMAEDVGTKIFRVYQPCFDGESRPRFFKDDLLMFGDPTDFEERHMDILLAKIGCWYDDGCKDMAECEVRFD